MAELEEKLAESEGNLDAARTKSNVSISSEKNQETSPAKNKPLRVRCLKFKYQIKENFEYSTSKPTENIIVT